MLKINIPYWKLKGIAENFPESYNALREAAKKLGRELSPPEELLAGRGYESFDGYVNDLHALPIDILNAAEFEPVPELRFCAEDPASKHYENIVAAMQTHQVHLPGDELIRIARVEVHEDLCTDELQGKLDDGWRIVAVVPRSAQRRPDYILGKRTV